MARPPVSVPLGRAGRIVSRFPATGWRPSDRMARSPDPGLRIDGRVIAPLSGDVTEPFRSLATDLSAAPGRIREGDREFEGATDRTALRLPGRSARARRAARASGRTLSTAGLREGWSRRN